MLLTIETSPSAEQMAFNLRRWNEIVADPELARLPHRIETDRHGHILMSPPPAPTHGKKQYRIGTLLERHLPEGIVITECPFSTSDGVKAIDVARLHPYTPQSFKSPAFLPARPET